MVGISNVLNGIDDSVLDSIAETEAESQLLKIKARAMRQLNQVSGFGSK